jgi:ornithine decarboxylase
VIGNIGAYGRAIGGRFNGYGSYEEVILLDDPEMTVYGGDTVNAQGAKRA